MRIPFSLRLPACNKQYIRTHLLPQLPLLSRMSTTGKSAFASAAEERRWNHLSDRMSAFHEYFKEEFRALYEQADGSFSKRGLSLPMYLETAMSFNGHLTAHHTIEERHVFPILAKRMPKFGTAVHEGHVDSHRAIHDGLGDLVKNVSKWRQDPTSYSPVEMRACLDGLKGVLFEHLDQEVEDLRGENLKQHFTLEEIEIFRRM